MKDEEKVVSALKADGIAVRSVWDLVNSSQRYRNAIPTLLRLLPEVENRKVKEAIVRALGVPEARGVAPRILIAEMKASRGDPFLGWAIGNTLSVLVTPKDDLFEDLADVLRDEELGFARQMLTDSLVKTKDPRVAEILVGVLPQEGMTGHALSALGAAKDFRSRRHVEKYLDHPNAFVRKQAKKALEKIDKAHPEMGSSG